MSQRPKSEGLALRQKAVQRPHLYMKTGREFTHTKGRPCTLQGSQGVPGQLKMLVLMKKDERGPQFPPPFHSCLK